MSEWQDISTAPKDGSGIILLIDGSAIEGRWYVPNYDGGVPQWDVVSMASHGCGCCAQENTEPTHWMPLPPPPQGAAA